MLVEEGGGAESVGGLRDRRRRGRRVVVHLGRWGLAVGVRRRAGRQGFFEVLLAVVGMLAEREAWRPHQATKRTTMAMRKTMVASERAQRHPSASGARPWREEARQGPSPPAAAPGSDGTSSLASGPAAWTAPRARRTRPSGSGPTGPSGRGPHSRRISGPCSRTAGSWAFPRHISPSVS